MYNNPSYSNSNFNIQQQIAQQLNVTPMVTPLDLGKKSRPPEAKNRNTQWTDEDLVKAIKKEIDDSRGDLTDLLLLNKAIVDAPCLRLDYEDKEKDYEAKLDEINQLAVGAKDDACYQRLEVLSSEIEFEIATLNARFPQIIYKGVYMREVSRNIIDNLGYQDNRETAQVAYASLVSVEPHLHLDKLTNADGNTSVQAAIRTIAMLNEMAKFKNTIEDIHKRDKEKQEDTQRKVMIGMVGTLITIIVIVVIMVVGGYGWDNIKGVKVIGIPLGVLIWSFIGSFAAMLEQFYRNPIHQFGSTLKWIIVRPVLGIVMAAGIYLAFVTGFEIGIAKQDGMFMLFIAFLIGLSDSFTFGMIDRLKSSVIAQTSLPGANVAAVPKEVVAPIIMSQPVVQAQPTGSTNLPTRETFPTSGPMGGEDE